MPHIHTKPGEIDRTSTVYIVHVPSKRVLFRNHDKYKKLLPPGGHIENYQTAPEAARAKAREEVGLDIDLWDGNRLFQYPGSDHTELIPPVALNIHAITPEHRHEDHVYFAVTQTMDTIEPEGREKSGGCHWFTKEEIIAHPELEERIRQYSLKALEILAP